MLLNARFVKDCATMVQPFVGRVKTMTNGTWRQQMMDLFLRREGRKAQKHASELAKKLSKDRANLKGLGEEE